MANLEAKDTKRIEREAKERADREKQIANQWLAFSKTYAYADLVEYMSSNHDLLISYAKERVMPSPVADGQQLIIDGETASSLLQNARGIDIVKTYVEGYVNIAT